MEAAEPWAPKGKPWTARALLQLLISKSRNSDTLWSGCPTGYEFPTTSLLMVRGPDDSLMLRRMIVEFFTPKGDTEHTWVFLVFLTATSYTVIPILYFNRKGFLHVLSTLKWSLMGLKDSYFFLSRNYFKDCVGDMRGKQKHLWVSQEPISSGNSHQSFLTLTLTDQHDAISNGKEVDLKVFAFIVIHHYF